MEKNEKKEITARTTVKAIITGFVSYGIIFNFVFLLIIAIGNYFLKDIAGSTARGLYVTLPLMAGIIIYLTIHVLCKLSTYDVFKKCKTNPSNYKKIVKYLNIFFIACIALSIILFLSLLALNLKYQIQSIDYAVLQYHEIFSNEHTQELETEMINKFNISKENLVVSTILLELSVAISFLSLIPYQRKVIVKYNEY